MLRRGIFTLQGPSAHAAGARADLGPWRRGPAELAGALLLATIVAAPTHALAGPDARGSSAPAADTPAAPDEEAPARGPAPPPHPPSLSPPAKLAPGKKRPIQDYEGRPRHSTVGEDLLWIPRVVLFPLYVFSDFIIRRPLGAVDMATERLDLVPKLRDFLTWGPDHNAGIIPTAFYDLGFRPSIGIYFFYDDFLAPHNDLRATFSIGGEKWVKARVADRIPLAVRTLADGTEERRSYLQLEVHGLDRPDYDFYGIGWNRSYDQEGRYEIRTVGGSALIHTDLTYASFLESWLAVSRYRLADGDCSAYFLDPTGPTTGPVHCHQTTLLSEVAAGHYPLPAGFADGYASTEAGGRLVLDSRPPRPAPGSGVAAELRGTVGSSFAAPESGAWVTYQGTLGGFVDVTRTRRVLSLTLDARFVDSITRDVDVPFSELAGAPRVDYAPEDDLMLGFKPGRLVGQSAVAATLGYEWPVWAFLDGTLQLAAGNTFGSHLEDFAFDRLRLSFVGGITTPNHRDHAVNVLLGFGTKPIVEGGTPESVRFLVGGTTGF